MENNTNISLTDFELDQLKEVVNIGASHASIALSQLVNKRIGLTVPEVSISNIDNTIKFIDKDGLETTTLIVKINGDANGILLFILPGDSGLKISNMVNPIMTNEPVDRKTLNENDLSTLKEIGNILAGSYLTALSKFLGLDIMHSVSEISYDQLGKVLKTLSEQTQSFSDTVFTFEVNLKIADQETVTELYLVVDPKFTQKILDMAKKKLS